MPSPTPDYSSPAIPVEKKPRESKLYLDDYTEQEMENPIKAICPLKGKDGGVSINKVKDMLKRATTLSELTYMLLNKK